MQGDLAKVLHVYTHNNNCICTTKQLESIKNKCNVCVFTYITFQVCALMILLKFCCNFHHHHGNLWHSLLRYTHKIPTYTTLLSAQKLSFCSDLVRQYPTYSRSHTHTEIHMLQLSTIVISRHVVVVLSAYKMHYVTCRSLIRTYNCLL